jgi:PAS domain S-box-containing protein
MAAAAQAVSASRLRVLMAGGDKVNLAHVSGLLAKSGYELTVVENGIAALQALESDGPPPLAVLDWTMPELNGIDVCRKMRNANRRRSTYIILLTAWNQRDDRVVGLEAGADDCVYKPVDVRELRVRLQIGAQIILERALRESEERFRSAFQYAGIGIAVVRLTGEFLQVNPALCNFLGYSADELLPMSLHAFSHPENVPTSEVLLGQFLKGEYRSGEFERRFVAKGGTAAWAALTVSVVLDADEHASCFVIQLQDISERKQAEQALKESLSASKQALKELADQQYAMDQHAIVGITDTEGRITYANDKFCAISKYSRAELLDHNHRIVNSGYHSKEFFAGMYETISRGMVWTGELRNRAKDGTFYWVDATIVPFLGSDGRPRQYVSIHNDITEHKTMEEALRRSEALFHAISHNVEDLMQVCDMNLNWLHTSESFRTKLGYVPEELLGTSSRQIIHPEDLPEVEARPSTS